ncbi:hypothetical protein PG995_004503 [Apiospora arundinis]
MSLRVVKGLEHVYPDVERDHQEGPSINDELFLAPDSDPDPDDEEPLQRFTIVSAPLDDTTDAWVYTATVEANGWPCCKTWIFKKHKNLQQCETEYAVCVDIEGRGIGPALRAFITDPFYESENPTARLPEVGLMLEYVKGRKAVLGNLEDLQGALGALRRLHALGWLHGDVEASNVLFRKSDGRAVLIEFAKARRTQDKREFDYEIDRLKGVLAT